MCWNVARPLTLQALTSFLIFLPPSRPLRSDICQPNHSSFLPVLYLVLPSLDLRFCQQTDPETKRGSGFCELSVGSVSYPRSSTPWTSLFARASKFGPFGLRRPLHNLWALAMQHYPNRRQLYVRMLPQLNTRRMPPQLNTWRMPPQLNTWRMPPQLNTWTSLWTVS